MDDRPDRVGSSVDIRTTRRNRAGSNMPARGGVSVRSDVGNQARNNARQVLARLL
jgi:hypothetical protein